MGRVYADFNPFEMDLDGDVDGIDFLGFDYLMYSVLGPNEEASREEKEDDPQEDETPLGVAMIKLLCVFDMKVPLFCDEIQLRR